MYLVCLCALHHLLRTPPVNWAVRSLSQVICKFTKVFLSKLSLSFVLSHQPCWCCVDRVQFLSRSFQRRRHKSVATTHTQQSFVATFAVGDSQWLLCMDRAMSLARQMNVSPHDIQPFQRTTELATSYLLISFFAFRVVLAHTVVAVIWQTELLSASSSTAACILLRLL